VELRATSKASWPFRAARRPDGTLGCPAVMKPLE
jgi:hypothetical protein